MGLLFCAAMTVKAETIWNESERYVALAAEHLNPRRLRPEHVVGAHDEAEWMRISYLFPTLPERSKTDLLSVRRIFLVMREQQERERTDPNESAEYAEAMSQQVGAALREALPSFSAVQREILDRYYLKRRALGGGE